MKNHKKLVLSYHCISKGDDKLLGSFPIDINVFDDQIKLLRSKGFQFKKITELDQDFDCDTVYLTFDDGTIDHFKNVMPFLEQKKIPAHFSINTSPFENKYPLAHKVQVKLALGNYPTMPAINTQVEKFADLIYHYETGYRRYVKYVYNIHLSFEAASHLLGEPLPEEQKALEKRFIMPEHLKNINTDLFNIGNHTKTHAPLPENYLDYINNEVKTWEADMQAYCPWIKPSMIFTIPMQPREGAQITEFIKEMTQKYTYIMFITNNKEKYSEVLYSGLGASVMRLDGAKLPEFINFHGL